MNESQTKLIVAQIVYFNTFDCTMTLTFISLPFFEKIAYVILSEQKHSHDGMPNN